MLSLKRLSLLLLTLAITNVAASGSQTQNHKKMDAEHAMRRDLTEALRVDVRSVGFSPKINSRSLFERQNECYESDSTICETTSRYVYCCPDNADCVNDNGVWRCNDNPFGLTRGQKIGIGIGVTVAFFVVCIAGLVIFCCCCRKAAKIASAAVSNQQNPQAYQSQPQPVMYGGPPMHDQHAIPMTATGPHVAGEGKSYADQGYPPQQPYDPYAASGQYPPQPYPSQQYQSPPSPAPPYQQPPQQQYQQQGY